MIRGNWRFIVDDGKFGPKTYAALKACQQDINWFDRQEAHFEARKGGGNVPGTSAYKKIYNLHRQRVKRDGIAGPITLRGMDIELVSKELLK